MIRARIEGIGGGGLILLGIVEGNVERLRQGHPIHADLADLGVPNTELLIWLGADHAALIAELEEHGISLPPGTHDQVKEADR